LISSALGVIGGVLAAAVLLGAAFSVFRASDLRSTVSGQKARIDALLIDREEDRRDLAAKDAAIEILSKRLELNEERTKNLEEIVAGRVDFSALETQIVAFATEMTRSLAEAEKRVMQGQKDIKALLHAHREGDS
jgi:hypothetical protein